MNDDLKVTVTLTAEDLAFYDQAKEAGIPSMLVSMYSGALKRLVAAEREKLAHWMMSLGYATGHGDTTEDLLDELEWQVTESWSKVVVASVEAEREACAQLCLETEPFYGVMFAEAIRARGEK